MKLATVATYDYPYQAHLAVSHLEDSGIPAHVFNEDMGGLPHFYGLSLGHIQVKVAADRLAEAKGLLFGNAA